MDVPQPAFNFVAILGKVLLNSLSSSYTLWINTEKLRFYSENLRNDVPKKLLSSSNL